MARVFAEARPDAVLNLAAETHVDRSIDGPRPFIDTNIVGTFVLLEAARRHLAALDDAARRAFRFLHVSTDEVYGTLGDERAVQRGDAVCAELAVCGQQGGGRSSRARLLPHLRAAGRCITNCSNNYGPFQFPEKLIPLMILNALDGRPLPIYGDGGNVRDWLHVDDHCGGILLVLRSGRPGEKYNIGGGNERTNLEIVDRICDALDEARPGRPASRRALKTFVADRPGHDRRYAIDATKIRRELGWAPRTRSKAACARRCGGTWIIATGASGRSAGRGRIRSRSRRGLGRIEHRGPHRGSSAIKARIARRFKAQSPGCKRSIAHGSSRRYPGLRIAIRQC